jgi:hypothetical protein
MKPKTKSMKWTVALAAVLALAAARPCAAGRWNVTSTADDGSAGTLRHALVNAGDGDLINITATGTINLIPAGGPLLVGKSVTINGTGQNLLTLDGGYTAPGTGVQVFLVGLFDSERPVRCHA